jgi:hypothetical protein
MPTYTQAGADAAGDPHVADAFRQILATDPDIQSVIRSVWGDTPPGQRPSDTPKHLEQANDRASKQIAQILKAKGIDLPDRTFINPRSGALEGHRGWSGLSGIQKAAIIAAAAAATGGTLAATGAFGALGGGGATAASSAGAGALPGGVTAPGVISGLSTLPGAAVPLSGAGASAFAVPSVTSGLGAVMPGASAPVASSWLQTLQNVGGGSGAKSWLETLTNPDLQSALGLVAGGASGRLADQRRDEGFLTNQANLADVARYNAAQNAQNEAGQLDLTRRQFTEQARGGRAKQTILADLLSNMRDVSINVPGVQTANVTGGLRPSALGTTGRQGAAELARQALAAQMTGDKFTGGEILPAPTFRPMPQRGGTERALDWIGLLGSAAGALRAPKTYLEDHGGTSPGASPLRRPGSTGY